jgi:hypothetical protein
MWFMPGSDALDGRANITETSFAKLQEEEKLLKADIFSPPFLLKKHYGDYWVPSSDEAQAKGANVVIPPWAVEELCVISHQVHTALWRAGIPNWMCMGSLLAVYRDHKMMPREWDFDLVSRPICARIIVIVRCTVNSQHAIFVSAWPTELSMRQPLLPAQC